MKVEKCHAQIHIASNWVWKKCKSWQKNKRWQCCWVNGILREKNPFRVTLLGCVLSPLHTKSQYFSIKNRAAPRDRSAGGRKKNNTLSCLHPLCALKAPNLQENTQHVATCPAYDAADTDTCSLPDICRAVSHSRGAKISLRSLSNPGDRITTPTRGWWKITSLQATGKWMALAVHHIVQPL